LQVHEKVMKKKQHQLVVEKREDLSKPFRKKPVLPLLHTSRVPYKERKEKEGLRRGIPQPRWGKKSSCCAKEEGGSVLDCAENNNPSTKGKRGEDRPGKKKRHPKKNAPRRKTVFKRPVKGGPLKKKASSSKKKKKTSAQSHRGTKKKICLKETRKKGHATPGRKENSSRRTRSGKISKKPRVLGERKRHLKGLCKEKKKKNSFRMRKEKRRPTFAP